MKDKKLVAFTSDGHIYTYGDIRYSSVTSVIGAYKNKFRTDYWSSRKALQSLIPEDRFKELKAEWQSEGRWLDDDEFIIHLLPEVDYEEFVVEKQVILDSWKQKNLDAINKGVTYHENQEERSYRDGKELNPFNMEMFTTAPRLELERGCNEARTPDLYDLPDGFYPELLLFNHEYRIAGQADKVFIQTDGKVRYVFPDDYKTGSRIKKSSYWDARTHSNMMMKPPLNHLMDCNLFHYEMQISTYGWMLEQAGFKVKDLAFHHLNQTYKLKYRNKEVQDMLMHWKAVNTHSI